MLSTSIFPMQFVIVFHWILCSLMWVYTALYRLINPVDRVFANGPGDLGSIPVRVIPVTLKMVLDTS